MTPDNNIENEVKIMRQELEALKGAFYLNNFLTSQDFNKYSRFNTRLKVPHYDTLPSSCETGDIGEAGGGLYICSAPNTWELVGSQV